MENWKRAVVAGSVGTSAILFLKGRRPAGVLMAGVGLAVLASEYPEKFEQIREELPNYVDRGTEFIVRLPVAIRASAPSSAEPQEMAAPQNLFPDRTA